jgi:hypothetical protein
MVLALAVLGGCFNPGPSGTHIDFEESFNVSAEGFSMSGTISESEVEGEAKTFDNVSVYLYNNDSELVRRVSVGSVGAGTRKSVSISTSTVPEYVIIYSPEFWEVDEISVDYFVRVQSTRSEYDYELHTAYAREDLPVSPGNEMNSVDG